MQELTQSHQELIQQIRANTKLANQLNKEMRRRSRRDYASYSSTESSALSDFNRRSTCRRLDGNYAEASRHQHPVNFEQTGIGPSTGHQAGPSSRGGDTSLSHHSRSCSCCRYRTGSQDLEPTRSSPSSTHPCSSTLCFQRPGAKKTRSGPSTVPGPSPQHGTRPCFGPEHPDA